MKSGISVRAAALIAAIAVAHAHADVKGGVCGDGIDWRAELEGQGVSGSVYLWSRGYSLFGDTALTANPFAVDRQPEGFGGSMTDPYVEHGDAIYKKLNIPFAVDFHAGLFNEFVYDKKDGKLTVTGVTEESNGEKTLQRRMKVVPSENGISLYQSSRDLVADLARAQWKFAEEWGRYNKTGWRGSRTPKDQYVGFHERKNIVGTARELTSDNSIGYTFLEMIEPKAVWNGDPQSVSAMRCDGVVELSYEHNGIKVWGEGDYTNAGALWNVGNAGHKYPIHHNDTWDAWGFDLGEVSPMIQAGCGGNGDGERTSLRSHAYHKPPQTYLGVGYRSLYASVYDPESEAVYYMVQKRSLPRGGWHDVIPWRRAATYEGFASDYIYQSGVESHQFRLVAVDQGGNVALRESIVGAHLRTGESYSFERRSYRTGVVTFKMYPSSDCDFNLIVQDPSTGSYLDGSHTPGSAAEEVSFFIREHQDYTLTVKGYRGSGTFTLVETGFIPAKRYRIDMPHVTERRNDWRVLEKDLPPAHGWAVTWSRWEKGSRDIDMTGAAKDGNRYGSYSVSDYEFMRTYDKPLSELAIYDFKKGRSHTDRDVAKNICHLWQVGGF